MGLKKSLLSGGVTFVVTMVLASAVGKKRVGTRVGLLAGGAVAVSTLLSGRERESDVEFEDEIAAE